MDADASFEDVVKEALKLSAGHPGLPREHIDRMADMLMEAEPAQFIEYRAFVMDHMRDLLLGLQLEDATKLTRVNLLCADAMRRRKAARRREG
ncbi:MULTISPECIES: hypothetical protein [Streptomyces]|uniref:hypothetical protein n=1 Tax=Streptomyces TaxID=1883 RepID=UPI00365BA387